MAGFIPDQPIKRQGGITVFPWVWCGDAAVDGAVGDWALAPLGSMYMRIHATAVVLYVRTVLSTTPATSDWHSVTVSA